MTQSPITPRTPTQAEINRAIGRGSNLRSQAFREAFAGLFAWIGAIGTHGTIQSKAHAA